MLGDGNLVVKSRPRSEMRFCSVFANSRMERKCLPLAFLSTLAAPVTKRVRLSKSRGYAPFSSRPFVMPLPPLSPTGQHGCKHGCEYSRLQSPSRHVKNTSVLHNLMSIPPVNLEPTFHSHVAFTRHTGPSSATHTNYPRCRTCCP